MKSSGKRTDGTLDLVPNFGLARDNKRQKILARPGKVGRVQVQLVPCAAAIALPLLLHHEGHPYSLHHPAHPIRRLPLPLPPPSHPHPPRRPPAMAFSRARRSCMRAETLAHRHFSTPCAPPIPKACPEAGHRRRTAGPALWPRPHTHTASSRPLPILAVPLACLFARSCAKFQFLPQRLSR